MNKVPQIRFALSQAAANFRNFLPGVVALPESRSTPGYKYFAPLGLSVAASQTVGE
jgi:hypothetical protein